MTITAGRGQLSWLEWHGSLEALGLPETPGEQGMAGLYPSSSDGKTQSMAGSFLGFKTDILVTTVWSLIC